MTQDEIEDAVFDMVTSFAQQYMGRRPRHIGTHLIGDLLVIRLQGVLTSAEMQMVRSRPSEMGRDLLKRLWVHLIATARPTLEAMVEDIIGVKVVSLHHDLSTATGEKVILFTLAAAPKVSAPVVGSAGATR